MTHRLLAATALLSCSLIANAADDAKPASEPMEPSATLQVLQSNSVKDFFETAASAGTFEIEAGTLAQARTSNPQIRDFAAKMLVDHGKAADELKKLAHKKKVQLPTAMLKRHQSMFDGLKDEKPGKDFDDEYRTKMILSHKEAVSLFDQAARKSEDADIKAFAAKTLPTLQHHGAMAKDLPES